MQRLDKELADRGLVQSRSQAENLIELGSVTVNGQVVTRPAEQVSTSAAINIETGVTYVSRAALKLKSADRRFRLDFKDKIVLDVGSSTGGFSDYSLQHGAKKIIAVDTGTEQLHPSLRGDERIELHEKTDIRDLPSPKEQINLVLIDVSFISITEVLPAITKLAPQAQIVAMVKPQFEAGEKLKNRGVIKNDAMRRAILKELEGWFKDHFVILDKADSGVSGKKGNQERFYLLKSTK